MPGLKVDNSQLERQVLQLTNHNRQLENQLIELKDANKSYAYELDQVKEIDFWLKKNEKEFIERINDFKKLVRHFELKVEEQQVILNDALIKYTRKCDEFALTENDLKS
jgi:deoxyribose-phosphate aldolase